MKNIVGKHIVKIEYIVGPNLEYTNLQYYAMKLKSKNGYKESIFELKKKMVYEKDSDSLYIAVHAMMDKRE